MQNKKLIHVVIILFMLLSLLPITPKQVKAASLNQIFLGEPQAVFSGRTISSGKKVVAIGKDSDGTLHMAGMVGLTPFTLSDLKGVPAYQLHNGSRELNEFYSTAMTDLDGDGKQDIVSAGPNGVQESPNNIILWNHDNQILTKQSTFNLFSIAFYGKSVQTGDVNNDGKNDIIWFTTDNVYVGINNSTPNNPSFSLKVNAGVDNQSGNNGCSMGDFNGDHNLDYICSTNNKNHNDLFKIGLGNGDGTFQLEAVPQRSDSIVALYVASDDLNQDGKDDFVLVRGSYPSKSIEISVGLRNSTNTGFDITLLSRSAFINGSIAIGDLNNDGYKDIALTALNNANQKKLDVHLNNGIGQFNSAPDVTTNGGDIEQLFIEDMNNDGVNDILTVGTSQVSYYPVNPYKEVTNLALDQTNIALKANATKQLTALFTPADATSQDVTWESSDSTIAAVDQNGLVTGLAEGSATITVTSTKDGTKFATCNVLVGNPPTLSNLTVSEGTLSPAFAEDTNDYIVHVDNAVTSLKVTPTVMDTAATIKVLDTDVTSESPSDELSLQVGKNSIPVVVKSIEGIENTYTLTVIRNASSPLVTSASTTEHSQTQRGLVITSEDGNAVTHLKISNIQGGALFKNDGTTVIQDEDFITIAEGNSGLKFTPTQYLNSVANDVFSFDVAAALDTTNSGLSNTAQATITVSEVNDEPIATDDTLSVKENAKAKIITFAELLANDKAGPENENNQKLSMKSVDNAVGGTVTIENDEIKFAFEKDFKGQGSFNYTIVDDGTTSGLIDPKEATGNVVFSVQENQIPTVNEPIANQQGIAGGDVISLDLSNTFKDLDNDSLTLSATSNKEAIATVSIKDNNLKINPLSAGQATITVTAEDDFGGKVTTDFEITVVQQYTVTFEVNGGSKVQAQKVKVGAVATKPSENPTKAGYTFGGWYMDRELTKVFDFTKGIVGNTTVYAKWEVISSGDGGSSSTPSTSEPTPKPTPTEDVKVLVNGKEEAIGKATSTQVGDQKVMTVTLDSKKLQEKLAAEGKKAVVTIPVNKDADIIIGELNAQMVKNMQNEQALVVIQTPTASYTLPASQINIDAISTEIGKDISLEDIKVQIEIAKPTNDMVKFVENVAQQGNFSLMVAPIEFTVKAVSTIKTVDITSFNAYVQRTITIPKDVEASKITTAIVVKQDGTAQHVPTKVIQKEGKYYAVINSLTNSTYALVWNPIEFTDVANHWSKEAVNNLGSRMIINGVREGIFAPNQDITRAQFAAIIVRALGLKTDDLTSHYADVTTDAWYASYINAASEYKLIQGYSNGHFGPNDKITRQQAMTILARALLLTDIDTTISEQEAATILAAFIDEGQIAEYAKSPIAVAVKTGLVTGKANKTIAPTANISRAEVAVIIERFLKKAELINSK
ncbi:S-layer homology domain-containing protein [Lysinibacillus sphaericus]|uniref:S-layer homology domain-containing protein n=1 Tax=Lysinibacillus sphaericus TaxID=1421 RepID=UPI0021630E67|nr:S-layer homology domain-containing protein [Lysinibacillus sphaericus]MCS1381735.1 S-layer homology domain-containing protein [Lysinibacillus sphaericus]